MSITRREFAAASAAAASLSLQAQSQPPTVDKSVVDRHDKAVEAYLKAQQTDPSHPECGGFPDTYDFYNPGSGSGALDIFNSAFICPQSRFYKDGLMMRRAQLCVNHLAKRQTPDGNWDLLITNWNSTPDAGFIMQNLCSVGNLARRHGSPDLVRWLEPVLLKAGDAMSHCGIHTPNHRWVVSSALAQLNEIYPNEKYIRRINQWLAEGIDMDTDDQFTERSTGTYNHVNNRALTLLALKLNKPELLQYVRRNLTSMFYLMHPGFEVVTEISRRQDLNTRATMHQYWFELTHMAVKDNDGRFAWLSRELADKGASLSTLLEYPELNNIKATPVAPPDNYEKAFPHIGVTRLRRGKTSVTLLNDNNRVITIRRGDAVINAVRFASAFFGKAQFLPGKFTRKDATYVATQSLDAGYYQPLENPRYVGTEDWGKVRSERKRTEVSQMTQSVEFQETATGISLRIRANGTDGVPLAVEINLREGGKLEGVEPSPHYADTFLATGPTATYRMGSDAIKITAGSNAALHKYTQVRGADPKLPGPCLYITGYTPFDKVIHFDWV